MSLENQEIDEFFVLISQGIKKHGAKKIARAIQVIDLQKNNVFFQVIFDYIIEEVCKEYKIEKADLIQKKKRGNATIARKIAVLVAKNHFDISDAQLAFQMNRTRQVIYNLRVEFMEDEKKGKHEKGFYERYVKINEKVVNLIHKLKNIDNGGQTEG